MNFEKEEYTENNKNILLIGVSETDDNIRNKKNRKLTANPRS